MTLFVAFLYFDMSFMVWTMLGAFSREIGEALALVVPIKILGWSKGVFDGYTAGLLIFAGVLLVALLGLSMVKIRWRTWGVQAGGGI